MKNYYEILQVDNSADGNEIKKAYARLLRKYPPEKCPEEFKEIREAYETLSNSKTRAEYDVFSKYKDEIDAHMTAGTQAMDEEDYEKAGLEFKKILVLEPSLSFARNYLGLSLMYSDKLDEAIVQFAKLNEDNPDNATYLYNLGMAYKNKEEYSKAEEVLIRATQIDKLNPSPIIALSNLYYEQENFKLAAKVLRDAIEEDGVVDFQDFIYFFELVEQNIYQGEIDMAEAVINEIEEILPDDKEAREYVAWKFANLAYELYKVKAYTLAGHIAKRASIIDPDNESISVIHKSSKELSEAFKLFDKLIKDDNIIGPIKGPIYYYLFDEETDEDERTKSIEENIEAIYFCVEYRSEEVENSIRHLVAHYKPLYELCKELFDDVMKDAQQKHKEEKQWEKLKDDSAVANGFKRLIALWLTPDLSKSERDKYFDSIMNELKRESGNRLKVSLDVLRYKYRDLYNLNEEFFKELEKAIRHDAHTSQSSSYSSHNTSNSSYNPSNKTYNQSHSSQSSSDCFVATAAFGTPWASEINILRQWRDEVLIKSIPGRLFVKTYYRIGPYAAKLVEKSELLKGMVRKVIYKIIKEIANNRAISR